MRNPFQDASTRRLRAFLCHASGDKQVIRNLYQRLQDRNIDSWLDEENLLPGQEWEQEIRKAVRTTDVVIVCLSRRSITKAGFVQKEIRYALDVADEQPEGTIFLIPLRLEECEIPERLRRWHWVNYFEGKGFERLISALKQRSESLGVEIAPIEYQPSLRSGLAPSLNQPLLPHESSSPASQSQQIILSTSSKKRISRRTFILLLAGGITLAGGGGITWLARLRYSFSQPIPSTRYQSSIGTNLYTYRGIPYDVRVLAWSPDGKRLAATSADFTAHVWDAFSTGNNVIVYRRHSNYVEGIAWSPDGKRIASGSADTSVQIWNPNTGNHIFTYSGHRLWVNRISWSPNGKYIVSGEQSSIPDKVVEVRIWEVATGQTTVIYCGHTNGVFSVAWSPNGKLIASCGYDGTLQVWEAATGNPVSIYRDFIFNFGLSWSPDSKRVAVGGLDPRVRVVDANSGSVVYTYDTKDIGSNAFVGDVAWSPDGKHIVAGSDNQAQVFNAISGTTIFTYGQSGHINAVGWSPNGRYIASGSDEGTIQVWQAE